MKSISCVIPAFNEEAGIRQTLEAVTMLGPEYIGEIIVVDDGSTDSTKKIVKKFNQVKLLENETNRGKSYSVGRGIEATVGEYVLLLDADLINLKSEDVLALIEPVLKNQADVTISMRQNTPWFMKIIGVDFMSGERVFPKKILEGEIENLKQLPSFGLEYLLNNIFTRKKVRLCVVRWQNVSNNLKYKKRGFWRGIKMEIEMWKDIKRTSPLSAIFTQNVELRRILLKDAKKN